MKKINFKQKAMVLLTMLAPVAFAAPQPIDTTDLVAQILVASAAVVSVGMAVMGVRSIVVAINSIRGALRA